MLGSRKSEDARNEGKKLFCLGWYVPNQCGQEPNPSDGLPPPSKENLSTESMLLGTLGEPFPCPFLTYQEYARCLSAFSMTVCFRNHLWGLPRTPMETQHSDVGVTVFCKNSLKHYREL